MSNSFKKIFCLVLVICMLMSSVAIFTACKKTDDTPSTPSCEHSYDNACDATCNKCGATREASEHDYSNACDATCNICGATREVGDHVDADEDDKCDECGWDLACDHEWDNDCDTTCNKDCGTVREANHSYDNKCDVDCNLCGATRSVGEHQDGAEGVYDEVCDECGATIVVPGVLDSVAGKYTYNDAVATLASNWNPHTYQVQDDSYPISFITTGLYNFVFNDAAINVVEGKDPFTGYKIVPEMAAALPVDVTLQVKAEHPEFNIPESATAGYAYTIALNPNATWQNGTPINADTYVWSMQQLLDPKLLNYRATDYYAQNFAIAGAEQYANQGQTVCLENKANAFYAVADLVLVDGAYTTPAGEPVYISVSAPLSYLSGNSLADYINAGYGPYFNMDHWEPLASQANEDGLVPCTEANLAHLIGLISTDGWGENESYAPCYLYYDQTYGEFDWANVGIYKTGEYEITIVLAKSLAGFNLLYNLTGNWIVYQPYYEANLYQDANGVWFSDYNTSVETTMSYGPYKMTQFQSAKSMTFERNENWFGYSDGKHKYQDPVDGNIYDMYQTDRIYCQVVPERITRKLMFLKGYLMGFGLGSEDFEEYRNSDRTYVSPSETIFFMILNGHKEAIETREAADDFDQSKVDLETMTLLSFRKAVAVTFNKEAMCTAVSPADSGGYGLFGESFIYDPDTGARYRDSRQAMLALCEFYSVDVDKENATMEELKAAVDSITGYDPETAKVLYTQAFAEALEAGYITDTNNDGICDQTVEITYAIGTDSSFYTKLLDYLNEKMNEVTAGTPFAGKIVFKKSAPLGNTWSDTLKAGMVDTVLGGWSGSALNPYSCTDLYTNPSYQYDAGWFKSESISKTLVIDGEEITMNLRQWSDALNGATVKVTTGEGEDAVTKEYCFGDGIASVEVRLEILAMIETAILGTYNYIPMLQEGSMSLLSRQVYYVVEEYNSVMGRGGMTYMRYNYDDAEWAAWVASQGGQVKY